MCVRSIGSKKLGQPVPDSNFVPERNSGKPHSRQTWAPLPLCALNTPQYGASVPCSRMTSRSSGVRSAVSAWDCSVDGGLRSKPAVERWAAPALVSGTGWFTLLSKQSGLEAIVTWADRNVCRSAVDLGGYHSPTRSRSLAQDIACYSSIRLSASGAPEDNAVRGRARTSEALLLASDRAEKTISLALQGGG